MILRLKTRRQLVLEYAERERAERGDLFATEAEMKMYRDDPEGMFGRRQVAEIVAEWVRTNLDFIRSFEVESFEDVS